MRQVTIVGAGLAGLTAAIILAREGHDVTVLEQEKAMGGASLLASAVSKHELCFADMTPLDLDAMSRYLGFPPPSRKAFRARAFLQSLAVPALPGFRQCHRTPASPQCPHEDGRTRATRVLHRHVPLSPGDG